jgi:hypothetical protein
VKILTIRPSRKSAWCHIFRIDAQLPDGTKKQYFIKVQAMYVITHMVRLIEVHPKADELRKRMMEGTYDSELLYHSYCPDHVPTPITWRSYGEDPDPWF